jgi:DNA-binding MarR family transcriptional regulator
LRRAYHIAKANTGAALNDLGITPMQAAAIMAVRRAGSLSQAELGRAIGMPPANVHGLVARLVKLHLVVTQPHPTDQRQVSVALAPAGLQHAERIATSSAAAQETTLAPLEPAEREVLIALLARIAR